MKKNLMLALVLALGTTAALAFSVKPAQALDHYEGEPCTGEKGKSGYMVASGLRGEGEDGWVCVVDDASAM